MKRLPGTDQYEVNALCATRNGDVWASTYAGQVLRLRGEATLTLDRQSGILGQFVQALLEDTDGNVWMGSEGGGLMQLREERVTSFSADSPSSIAATPDGRLFMGSFTPSTFFEVSDRGVEPLRELPETLTGVLTLAMGPDQRLYLGSFGYSHRYDLNGRMQALTNDVIHARYFLWDRQADRWTGRYDMVQRDRADKVVSRFLREKVLPDSVVTALVEDGDGSIWVGTTKGLCRIHGEQIEQVPQGSGQRIQNVRAMFLDSDGILWVGMIRGGLSAWKRDERRFATLTVEQGLLDDSVQQIIDDRQGDLWLGTDSGIMRFRRQDLRDWLAGGQARIYGAVIARDEGLVPPNCGTGFQPSAVQAPDGRLWFCSTAFGVAVIDPTRIQPKLTPPPVYIESVTVDGQGTEFLSERPPANTHSAESANRFPAVVVPPGARQVRIE